MGGTFDLPTQSTISKAYSIVLKESSQESVMEQSALGLLATTLEGPNHSQWLKIVGPHKFFVLQTKAELMHQG